MKYARENTLKHICACVFVLRGGTKAIMALIVVSHGHGGEREVFA